jgi:hypothetical protein
LLDLRRVEVRRAFEVLLDLARFFVREEVVRRRRLVVDVLRFVT